MAASGDQCSQDLQKVCVLDLKASEKTALLSIYQEFVPDLVSETSLPLQYPYNVDDEACCEDRGEGACGISSECACVAMTGNFYTGKGRLRLDVLPPNLPLVECGPLCQCEIETCLNRVTQHPSTSSLKIGRAKDESEKGFFCAATRPLQKGAFVSLYAGELLSKRTSNERRGKRKLEHPDWGNYILALKENGKTLGMVDATQTGNIGRFLNHSCDPNCVIQLVRWGPRAFPRPAIFTRRRIGRGEELTWDYGNASCDPASDGEGYSQATPTQLKPCLCGASNCRGFLPFDVDEGAFHDARERSKIH